MAGSITSPTPTPTCATIMCNWFKTMADIAGDLGAPAIGTQFGIFTYRDYDDPSAAATADGDRPRLLARGRRTRQVTRAQPTCSGSRCRSAASSATRMPTAQALQDWIDAGGLPIPLQSDGRYRPWRCILARPRRHRSLSMGRSASPTQSPIIHIKQSDHEQGRPLAVHRTVQQGRPHHAGTASGSGADGRRRGQRTLPRTRLPRTRADRPQRGRRLEDSVAYWAPYTKTGFN